MAKEARSSGVADANSVTPPDSASCIRQPSPPPPNLGPRPTNFPEQLLTILQYLVQMGRQALSVLVNRVLFLSTKLAATKAWYQRQRQQLAPEQVAKQDRILAFLIIGLLLFMFGFVIPLIARPVTDRTYLITTLAHMAYDLFGESKPVRTGDRSIGTLPYFVGERLDNRKDFNKAVVWINIERIVPSERKIYGTLSLLMPLNALKGIWSIDKQEFVNYGEGTTRGSMNIKSDYSELPLEVSILSRPNYVHEVPLKSFYTVSSIRQAAGLVSSPVTLAMSGNPESYPSDVYRLDIMVQMKLPKGLCLLNTHEDDPFLNSGCSRDEHLNPGKIEPTIKLIKDTSLESRNIRYSTIHNYVDLMPADANIWADDVDDYRIIDGWMTDILISRDIGFTWYVYAITLIPGLFAVILFRMFLLSRNVSATGVQSTLVGTVAVLLAILPLRGVLVPAEIQGLTRVDLILGMEALFVAFVLGVRYSFSLLWPSRWGRTN
jgi:hypothetical protein